MKPVEVSRNTDGIPNAANVMLRFNIGAWGCRTTVPTRVSQTRKVQSRLGDVAVDVLTVLPQHIQTFFGIIVVPDTIVMDIASLHTRRTRLHQDINVLVVSSDALASLIGSSPYHCHPG